MSASRQLRVAHETVIRQPLGPPLHISTISATDLPGIDLGPRGNALAPLLVRNLGFRPVGPDDAAALVADRVFATEDKRHLPDVYDPTFESLLTGLDAIRDPATFARAALTAVMVDDVLKRVPPRGRSTYGEAAGRLMHAPSQSTQSRVPLPGMRLILGVAASARLLVDEVEVQEVMTQAGCYEIPFGLSPETDKTKLDHVTDGLRQVYLLPLGAGALPASNELSLGHFLVAGEYAAGAVVITVVFAGGIAIAERLLGWSLNRHRAGNE